MKERTLDTDTTRQLYRYTRYLTKGIFIHNYANTEIANRKWVVRIGAT